ncbi:hypothetical protein [Streptomyces nitrosporeus]|uniref:Uncharacterized protein n=1 Tax=Streptomyces nitrosporeus TaxID=28894 RepID=A0A5J6FFC8_9ACTN|nr:hypothetical protein [Streptomyces nitrosporeus]QEU74487.1 hypothetical protein CP967_23080 [Streptomyces nitrosporeus]GGY83459.1 hypothetical protein GCM10010327_12120 [Streptomyces nitrosporeus]
MGAPPHYDLKDGWQVERIPGRPVMRVIEVRKQDTSFDLPLLVTFNGHVRGAVCLRLGVDEAIDLVDELNLALDARVREPVTEACAAPGPVA